MVLGGVDGVDADDVGLDFLEDGDVALAVGLICKGIFVFDGLGLSGVGSDLLCLSSVSYDVRKCNEG